MSLAKKAAAGFLWTAASNIGSRIITIASTFVLTRYLAPAVQGEVNVAYVFITTAGWVTSLGVTQYFAAHPKADRAVGFHASVLVLVSGAIACLGCFALRHLVAEWLRTPGMVEYVPGLAVSFYLDRLGSLPRAMLVRDMRFRIVGMRVALGELVYAGSSVSLAMLGWGGHSIVGGNLARGLFSLVLVLSVTNWRDYLQPTRLTWKTMRELARFGAPISVSYIFRIGASNWDNLFIAFRFGEATTGLYNQAYRLADLPASNLGEQINDVLVPTFARLDDPAARRRGLVRACTLRSLVVFPMAKGRGVGAPTAVEALDPASYAGVAGFLSVLATLGMTRSIGLLASGYLQVARRTRTFMITDAVLVTTLLALMALLAPFGALWSAVGVVIAFTLNTLHLLHALQPEGIRRLTVLGAVARPFLACLVMVAAVLGVRHLVSDLGWPVGLRLPLEVATGVLTYVAAALAFARDIVSDGIGLFLGAVRRRRAPAGVIAPALVVTGARSTPGPPT